MWFHQGRCNQQGKLSKRRKVELVLLGKKLAVLDKQSDQR